MNWYYVDAGQQAGPVDDAQLEALLQSGRVQLETLVWREGMAEWQPYHYVRPGGGSAAATAAPPVALGADQAVCAECGGLFNLQDTIPYGGLRVCARCKPVFMQKLAEGAVLKQGEMAYAGFWIRFGAYLLDVLILWVVNVTIGLIGGLGLGRAVGAQPSGTIALQLILVLVQLCIGVTYETVMIGRFGATLGKMACKLKVVTASGGKVSYMLAFGRYFAKVFSGLTCSIGFIIAGFDEQKRALHDRLCETRVVINQ